MDEIKIVSTVTANVHPMDIELFRNSLRLLTKAFGAQVQVSYGVQSPAPEVPALPVGTKEDLTVGDACALLLQRMNGNRHTLAKKLGASYSAVSHWIQGRAIRATTAQLLERVVLEQLGRDVRVRSGAATLDVPRAPWGSGERKKRKVSKQQQDRRAVASARAQAEKDARRKECLALLPKLFELPRYEAVGGTNLLAEDLKVHPTTLSNWKSGARVPSYEVLQAMKLVLLDRSTSAKGRRNG